MSACVRSSTHCPLQKHFYGSFSTCQGCQLKVALARIFCIGDVHGRLGGSHSCFEVMASAGKEALHCDGSFHHLQIAMVLFAVFSLLYHQCWLTGREASDMMCPPPGYLCYLGPKPSFLPLFWEFINSLLFSPAWTSCNTFWSPQLTVLTYALKNVTIK